MKIESEIRIRYENLKNSGSTSKAQENIQYAEIRLLEWILKCETCKRVYCNCDDPF